jgi:hypothetical protein
MEKKKILIEKMNKPQIPFDPNDKSKRVGVIPNNPYTLPMAGHRIAPVSVTTFPRSNHKNASQNLSMISNRTPDNFSSLLLQRVATNESLLSDDSQKPSIIPANKTLKDMIDESPYT